MLSTNFDGSALVTTNSPLLYDSIELYLASIKMSPSILITPHLLPALNRSLSRESSSLRHIVIAIIKVIQLTDLQRLQLEEGFRQGKSHAYRMRCRAVLLKSTGLTLKQVGEQTEMTHISINSWVKRFDAERYSVTILSGQF